MNERIAFAAIWRQLQARGLVDDVGGAEYRGRFTAWVKAGYPVDIEAWIVEEIERDNAAVDREVYGTPEEETPDASA